MAFAFTGYGIASSPIAAATLAGSPPVIGTVYAIDALNGSYSITGQTINFTRSILLLPQSGSYSVAGQPAAISYVLPSSSISGYGIAALPIASFPIAGALFAGPNSFLLSAQNGLYSLTGQAVDITYTPFTPPVTGPTQYFIEIRSFTESRRI